MNLSYTAIHSLMQCEYSYYLRYIKRVPTIESSASVYGTAIHKAIQVGYENNLDKEDWAKMFKMEWVALTAKKDIVYYSEGEYLKKFKAGQQMMRDYYDKFVAKNKPPQTLEFFFGRDHPVMLGNHKLIGVVDQIDAQDNVIDYKSGAKPTQSKLDFDLQFTIYSYAYRQLWGRKENGLFLRHLGTMKDMTTTRTEEDFEVLEGELDKIEKRLKGNVFIRNLGRDCSSCFFVESCLGKVPQIGRW